MRIAYGVFGYGRGHATRSAAVLPELHRQHDVLILAGGDAYDALTPRYPVVRIPTLTYEYAKSTRRSNYLTLKRNIGSVLDMLLRGSTFQSLLEVVSDFRPEVIISDAEPWLHNIGRRLGIPRIGFDHFGILVYCRPRIPWGDRLRSQRDVLVYRLLMRRPERVIVSSFYDAPPRRPGVCVVGPLLRDEVLAVTPTRGDYLLAYINKGEHQFTSQMEYILREAGMPVLVYGVPRQDTLGNLNFRSASNLPFLEDMAGCRAIFSTAGNQLVGEALHLGKPMLVVPEDSVEQRLNAASLEYMQIGMQVRHSELSQDVLQTFLEREALYLDNIRRHARDGRREALVAIERYLGELAGSVPRPASMAKVS
ncbi:MAG: glycosyltransferase family protein [Planctomycetota bacterium]